MEQDKSNFEHIEDYTIDQDKRLIKNDTSLSTFLSTSSSATNVAVEFQEKEGITVIEEKTSAVAWIETLVCMGVSTSCAFMWTTGASAPNVMSQWMNVSLSQINWLSNASAICNTVFSLLTAWAYEKIGIKASIVLCAVINTVGCWIRCIAIILPIEKRYPVVMAGQFIASIGGPLIYNLLQSGLRPKIVVSQTPCYLIIVASISTVFTIPTFFIPNKPKVPPSATATLERTPFWQGVKQVVTNMQFWWIAIITSVSMGMVFSVSVLIMEAISPFGYTEQQAGICAALIVFSGCFGGVIPDAFSVVVIACIINGFCSYALFPVYLEVASEITYPVSESISSCVLWTLCSLTMVVFSLIIDALRAGPNASPPNNMNTSMIVVAGIMFVGNLPCLWIKGDLKRSKVDNENRKKFAPVV
ncbi:major facilitator superfamily domain-containing protein [Parasitella parasitica]|nr:major facilitator superfamily domain-containing protein [Parasitella parasitica]